MGILDSTMELPRFFRMVLSFRRSDSDRDLRLLHDDPHGSNSQPDTNQSKKAFEVYGVRIEDLGGWNVTPMSTDKNKHYQRQFTLRTCEKSAPGRAARVEADQRLGSVTTSGGRSQ